MHKTSIKERVIDKVLLILTALTLGIALLGFIFGASEYFSRGWVIFFLLCIGYITIVTKFSLPYFKSVRNKKVAILLLSILELSVISIFSLIIHIGLLELPQRGILMWGIPLGGLGAINVKVFSILVKKLGKKEDIYKNKGTDE